MLNYLQAVTRPIPTWNNGINAYILPIKTLRIKYCSQGGSSKHIRPFLTSNLVSLATKYPSVEFVIEPFIGCHPELIGYFYNGRTRKVGLRKMTAETIEEQIQRLLDTRHEYKTKFSCQVRSTAPAIRPIWSPFHDNDCSIIKQFCPKDFSKIDNYKLLKNNPNPFNKKLSPHKLRLLRDQELGVKTFQ